MAILMVVLWDFFGFPIGFLHDISLGFLCSFYEIAIGFLLDSCGISMICL